LAVLVKDLPLMFVGSLSFDVFLLVIRITKFNINVVFGSLRRVLFESLREYIGDGVSSIHELLVP